MTHPLEYIILAAAFLTGLACIIWGACLTGRELDAAGRVGE